jgi:hypothetical protein
MLTRMEVFVGFLVLLLLMAALAFWAGYQEKKRQDALAAAVMRLGMRYSPEKDRGLAQAYEWINVLCRGENRYAFDVIQGSYRDQQVLVFSYHYETHSTDSKGRRSTSHYHYNIYSLGLPRDFPQLTIVREGFLSKIAQVFGYDDIDFESHEFSKTFCVRCGDKKLAYDVCHVRTMEYLLANKDLNIELEGNRLAFIFEGKVKREELEGNLLRLVQFRELMPGYLLQN